MKTYKHAFVLLAIILGTTACKQNEPDTTTTEKSFLLTKGASYYWGNAGEIWGDDELAGSNVLALDLYSERLSYNNESQEYVGAGYNLYIENIFVDTTHITLAPGTYAMDSISGAPFTFTPGIWTTQNYPYGAYLTTVKGTTISYEIITAGTFTVSEKGDSTIIDFTLQKEDGTIITPQFRGMPDKYDASGSNDYSFEPQPATTQDWTFTHADTAICYSDYYGNNTANMDLYMGNDDVFAYLELNCPPLTGDSIPVGRYEVNTTHQAYTVTASGGYVADENYDLPSFIGIYKEGNTYSNAYYLISGTLDVSRTAGNYMLELNAVSYFGSTIHAIYNGDIHVKIPVQKSRATISRQTPGKRTATPGKRNRMMHGNRIEQ